MDTYLLSYYHYQAFGLHIQSTYCLPELLPPDHTRLDSAPDLLIRPAQKCDHIPPASAFPGHAWESLDRLHLRTPSGDHYLFWPQVGRAYVADGQLIALSPNPEVSEDVLRLHILGSAMGILLYQRGLLPIHASAVQVGDHAVAFMGMWGAGKSTMAAAMHVQGYPLLTDDIVAISLNGPSPTIAAGFPQMKLWPDTVTIFGDEPTALAPVLPDEEKRKKTLTDAASPQKLPLRSIYLLEDGPSPQIEQLPAKMAFFELLTNWYGARFGADFLNNMERKELFSQTSQLVQRIPLFALIRPNALEQLPALVQMIAQHSMSLPHGSSRS